VPRRQRSFLHTRIRGLWDRRIQDSQNGEGMDCQCVVVYTVISPSTTIVPALRVQIEDTLARPSASGCISWIRRYIKRFRLVYSVGNCINNFY